MNLTRSPSENTRNRKLWWAIGLSGLGITLAVALITSPIRVEMDLQNRALSKLKEAGIHSVDVNADGRDLHLTGKVSSSQKLADVLASVSAVPGVSSLSHNLSAEAQPQNDDKNLALISEAVPDIEIVTLPPQLTVIRRENKLIFSGTLSNPERLTAVMGDLGASMTIENKLIKNSDVNAANWVSGIEKILVSLPVVSEARLDVTGSVLALSGTVESQTMLENVTEHLDGLSAPDFTIQSSLSVSEPEVVVDVSVPLDEPDISVVRENNTISLTGTLPNSEAMQSIMTALSDHYDVTQIDNTIKISDSVGEAVWLDELNELLPSLKSLESARVTVKNGTLILSGSAASAEIAQEQDLATEAVSRVLNVKNEIVILEVEPESRAQKLQQDLAGIDLKSILFESNSADINPVSLDVLNQLAETLKQFTDYPVVIAGHTDATGDDQWNQYLSQLRANAVRDYLIDLGIDKDRLSAIGYGESKPIATNSTRSGRALNRRIEVNY